MPKLKSSGEPVTTTLRRRLVGGAATVLLAASPLLIPTVSEAAPLTCRASMSDGTPQQYSNTNVRVTTASYARVKTVAHYKTTNTAHSGKANSQGRATIGYYISGATPGYRVHVDVTVTKNGRTGHCATSFVAHR